MLLPGVPSAVKETTISEYLYGIWPRESLFSDVNLAMNNMNQAAANTAIFFSDVCVYITYFLSSVHDN